MVHGTQAPGRPQPGPQGSRRHRPTSGSLAALDAGPVCSLTTFRGPRAPERPHSPFGKPRLQGAGPPPWSPRVDPAAGGSDGRTPPGHMRHPHHPTSGPPHSCLAPPSLLTRLQHQALGTQGHGGRPVRPCGPSPGSRASGPHPAPGFLLNRQAGRRLRKPAARGLRKGLHQPPVLPASGRTEAGGPGLPQPGLVKPAQQHPRPSRALRPRCHQRLSPAMDSPEPKLPPRAGRDAGALARLQASLCPSRSSGLQLSNTEHTIHISPPAWMEGSTHNGAFICTFIFTAPPLPKSSF